MISRTTCFVRNQLCHSLPISYRLCSSKVDDSYKNELVTSYRSKPDNPINLIKPATELDPNSKPKPPESIAVASTEDDVGLVGGIPEEHIYNRRARIFIPTRNAAQSGLNNTHIWRIEFDNRERWENSLMGWASNSDPLSNILLQLKFATAEDAIAYCDRNGWEYEVVEPHKTTVQAGRKAYGSNFSWSKRTRVSTK